MNQISWREFLKVTTTDCPTVDWDSICLVTTCARPSLYAAYLGDYGTIRRLEHHSVKVERGQVIVSNANSDTSMVKPGRCDTPCLGRQAG